MSFFQDFWGWAKTRSGTIIVLAIIAATIIVVGMAFGNEQSLYDAIIKLAEIFTDGRGG